MDAVRLCLPASQTGVLVFGKTSGADGLNFISDIQHFPINLTMASNLQTGKSYRRLDAFPLDASSVYSSLAEAMSYVATDPTAYVTQPIGVIEGGVASLYVIQPDKTLQLVGSGGSGASGNLPSYAMTFQGDGTTTEFTVTHDLGVKAVETTILLTDAVGTEYTPIFVATRCVSDSTAKIVFAVAPTSTQHYLVQVRA